MAPSSKTGKREVALAPKKLHIALDGTRTKQLAEIEKKNGCSSNAAIQFCISYTHGHLKKEWPDDFKA